MKKKTLMKLIYMLVFIVLALPLYGRSCDSLITTYFGCSVGLNSILICVLIDCICE